MSTLKDEKLDELFCKWKELRAMVDTTKESIQAERKEYTDLEDTLKDAYNDERAAYREVENHLLSMCGIGPIEE